MMSVASESSDSIVALGDAADPDGLTLISRTMPLSACTLVPPGMGYVQNTRCRPGARTTAASAESPGAIGAGPPTGTNHAGARVPLFLHTLKSASVLALSNRTIRA